MTGRMRTGILALGLAVTLAVAFGVTAKDTSAQATGTVAIDSAAMAVGGSAPLDVRALGVTEPGLGAWSIDIIYDPDAVSVVTCVAEQGGVCNPEFAANMIRFTGANASGLQGDTKLAEITFSCDVEGTSAVTVSLEVLADATVGDPQPIEATTQDGQITCGDFPDPTPAPTPDVIEACAVFEFQEDAQQALISDPSDPLGLDPEGNGIACEHLPSRFAPISCDDFGTQEEAQKVLDADPTDPFGLDPEGNGIACEDLPRTPKVIAVAGTGPGPMDWGPGGLHMWLIAGLIGAGIAYFSTGVAGVSLAFIGERRSKNASAPRPERGPFDVMNEVVIAPDPDFQPRMRPTGTRWHNARKRLAQVTLDDVPGFRPPRR